MWEVIPNIFCQFLFKISKFVTISGIYHKIVCQWLLHFSNCSIISGITPNIICKWLFRFSTFSPIVCVILKTVWVFLIFFQEFSVLFAFIITHMICQCLLNFSALTIIIQVYESIVNYYGVRSCTWWSDPVSTQPQSFPFSAALKDTIRKKLSMLILHGNDFYFDQLNCLSQHALHKFWQFWDFPPSSSNVWIETEIVNCYCWSWSDCSAFKEPKLFSMFHAHPSWIQN